MKHRKKHRNVGIVGIGQTQYSSHREDVNQPEMLHEAVRLALDDCGIKIDDVDAIVHGDRYLALQALTLDPMITDLDTARAIFDDFLKEFDHYLPQFA